MLSIHKSQSGHELFTALCIVGDSDLARIYEYLTHHVEVRTVKNESIVIVVSGNWEYDTGLFWFKHEQTPCSTRQAHHSLV